MIVVIADDLTGAAELGGIGVRYGLDVEIETEVNTKTKADLVVISADSRSLPEKEAVALMATITKDVARLKPGIIYKKVDSVMRGHIVEELKAQMEVMHMHKALLVSANPLLGRTIRDRVYFIQDQPIHTTSFSNDPEFPVKSSDVLHMLHTEDAQVQVRKKEEGIIDHGITVGEALDMEDLKTWASQADASTFLAGAANFFIAVLEKQGHKVNVVVEQKFELPGTSSLFVCGTTFQKSREEIYRIWRNNGPVSYMPLEIINSTKDASPYFDRWSEDVVSLLKKYRKAIIAIDDNMVKGIGISAKDLREKTAEGVQKILTQFPVHELVIEGGSTAASIIKALGLKQFIPVNEYAQGVIRMKSVNEPLYLTIKPGSYNWPENIWNF